MPKLSKVKKFIPVLREQGAEIFSAIRASNRHVRAISPRLWWWQLAGSVFNVLSAATAVLGLSFGYQRIIERAVSNGEFRPSWPIALLALGGFLAYFVMSKVASIVADLNRKRFTRAENLYLTRRRIAKVNELDLGAIMSPDFARLTKWRQRYGGSCIREIWEVQFDLITDLLRATVGIGIVVAIDARIACFALAPALIDVVRDWRRRQRTVALRREGYEDDRKRSLFSGLFNSGDSISAMRLRGRDHPWAAGRFERHAAADDEREDWTDRREAFDDYVVIGTSTLIAAALGVFLAWMVVSGKTQIAAAVSLFYGFTTLVRSATSLLSTPSSLAWRVQDFRFFLAFEKAEPLVKEPDLPVEPTAGPVSARADAIEFRYPLCLPCLDARLRSEMGIEAVRGERPVVLRGLSLDVRAGELVAVVGSNGSGKSTMLALLAREYLPERGEIRLSGVPTARIGRGWFPRRMAFMPQRFTLHELPLEEAVTLDDPETIDRDRLARAAAMSGADEVVATFDDGWQTLYGVEEGGVALSGGQKQRLALCGATYQALGPTVGLVALDEPTSQMDAAARHRYFGGITALAREAEKTLVVATHDFGWLHLFDRIVVIGHGTVTDEVSSDEVHRMTAAQLTERLMR